MQLMPGTTLEENLKKGVEYCRRAKAAGADIVLFPEMWSCGYTISEDIHILKETAVTANGEFVAAFGSLAAELNMAIGITFLESCEPLPRNTICLFDRFGKMQLKYSKVHTCDFGDECRLTAGDDFFVADIDTVNGSVKVGAMICYDREFPESARIPVSYTHLDVNKRQHITSLPTPLRNMALKLPLLIPMIFQTLEVQ